MLSQRHAFNAYAVPTFIWPTCLHVQPGSKLNRQTCPIPSGTVCCNLVFAGTGPEARHWGCLRNNWQKHNCDAYRAHRLAILWNRRQKDHKMEIDGKKKKWKKKKLVWFGLIWFAFVWFGYSVQIDANDRWPLLASYCVTPLYLLVSSLLAFNSAFYLHLPEANSLLSFPFQLEIHLRSLARLFAHSL